MLPDTTIYTFTHTTTTGNTYPIEIGYRTIDPQQVVTDRAATLKACREGCKRYGNNGGCPPYAPDYAELRKQYPFGVTVFSRLYTRHFPEKVLHGNFYVRWVFVETVLSRVMANIGLAAREATGGYFLGTGHCIGCKQCAFKTGETICRRPEKRTFSMESTGILVTEFMKKEVGFELQWWKPKEPEYIPEYMTKVTLLLTKEPLELDTLRNFFPNTSLT